MLKMAKLTGSRRPILPTHVLYLTEMSQIHSHVSWCLHQHSSMLTRIGEFTD